MDLTTLLNSPMGKGLIENFSSQLGINKNEASTAVNVAVPAILAGLTKNAQSKEGAESLNKALESKHDGSLLDNLASLLKSQSGAIEQDGNGILGHIFGNNLSAVEKGVAKQSGLSLAQVGPLLSMLAPIVMAFVGKQKQQSKTAAGGLDTLLGGLLGATGSTKKSTAGGLLDMVGGLIGGGGSKKSGGLINDILGGLLK